MRATDLVEAKYKAEADFEKAVDYAVRKCPNYIRKFAAPAVWRGSDSELQYAVINPKAVGRSSAHTTNEYTTILSNDPVWAKYPKRSQSLICTLDSDYASTYGSIYAIILPDKFRLGVCPRADIWESFIYLNKMTGIDLASQFNELLRWLLEQQTYGRDSKSYQEIRQGLVPVEEYIKNFKAKGGTLDGKVQQNELYVYLYNRISETTPVGTAATLIFDLLDPKKNKFRIINDIDSLADAEGEACEVWTDSTVLMVEESQYTEVREYAFSILKQQGLLDQ